MKTFRTKKITAIFDRGYIPKAIAQPILDLAAELTETVHLHARAARRRLSKKKGAALSRHEVIVIKPDSVVVHQAPPQINLVPSGSLCIFTLPIDMVKLGHVLKAEDWHITSLCLKERFPKSQLVGLIYEWVLNGHCPGAFSKMDGTQLSRVALAIRLENRPLPSPAAFQAALKRATREGLQTRLPQPPAASAD